MKAELLTNQHLIQEFMGVDKTKRLVPYHSCWNNLMLVVEKIESFQDGEDGDSMRGQLYNFRIEQHFVEILNGDYAELGDSIDIIIKMNGDSKIDATYKAVVQFIKYYNQNK